MNTYYIARHGQTEWNKNKRFQSRNDIPLNDTGIKQAEEICNLFNHRKLYFDAIYASPLSRASVTAKIISGAKIIVTDDNLLEIAMGDFEGRYESDLEKEKGEDFNHWRNDIFIRQAPNGESFDDAYNRAEKFIIELNNRHQDSNILIVAHQGINVALQAVLSQSPQPWTNTLHKYKQHNDEVNIWQGSALPFVLKEQLRL